MPISILGFSSRCFQNEMETCCTHILSPAFFPKRHAQPVPAWGSVPPAAPSAPLPAPELLALASAGPHVPGSLATSLPPTPCGSPSLPASPVWPQLLRLTPASSVAVSLKFSGVLDHALNSGCWREGPSVSRASWERVCGPSSHSCHRGVPVGVSMTLSITPLGAQ